MGIRFCLWRRTGFHGKKQDVLRALGAELVITPSEALPGEPRSCMNVAGNLVNNIPNAFFAGMYDHPLNLEVHREAQAVK